MGPFTLASRSQVMFKSLISVDRIAPSCGKLKLLWAQRAISLWVIGRGRCACEFRDQFHRLW